MVVVFAESAAALAYVLLSLQLHELMYLLGLLLKLWHIKVLQECHMIGPATFGSVTGHGLCPWQIHDTNVRSKVCKGKVMRGPVCFSAG